MTALLGDFIVLFSFVTSQVEISQFFQLIQNMSGLRELMSLVLFPNQTHKKNQNLDPKHMCLLFRALFRMSWSMGKHRKDLMLFNDRSPQMEMGIMLRNNLNRVFLTCWASLTLKSPHLCSSEHSSCRYIFFCSTRLKNDTYSFVFALSLSPSYNSFFHQTFV